MTESPSDRALWLRTKLDSANRAYHELDDPIINDAEFDVLFKELVALETRYPELLVDSSPTQRVGGPLWGTHQSGRHGEWCQVYERRVHREVLRAQTRAEYRICRRMAQPGPRESSFFIFITS